MRGEPGSVRPQTHALDALIREALAALSRGSGAPRADALLFLGNPHHAFPALVVQDPVLEPVDKLVWMVIYQHGHASAVSTPFPHYRDIARLANIASTSTIARALAILRATRWLSLCARGRDASGRFSGNVYALHDEPLPFADALHLDPGYLAFLREAATHHHARVRQVVAAISVALGEAMREGLEVDSPEARVTRRIEARSAIERAPESRYFGLDAHALSVLRRTHPDAATHSQPDVSKASQHQYSKTVRHQNSKAVEHQNSNAAVALPDSLLYRDVKNDYKNIPTTTTTAATSNNEPLNFSTSPRGEALDTEPLIYPRRLTESQRVLAARHLGTAPRAQHQALLDELEGRLQAEQRGARPVYDVLRYLQRMCTAAREGAFAPNLGLRVAQERERERVATEREVRARAERAEADVEQPLGERAVQARAELKRLIGLTLRRGPDSAG